MKLKLAALVALVISAVQAPVAQAQEVHPSGDAELMTLRYAESYDSLLNSYYLRRNAHRHLRSARELSLEEFLSLIHI